jgi:O-acetyl-ADP-ribose deacetylase (regulator of RNase III)
MNDSSALIRSSPWHPNEGETACFSLPADRSLWIRNGCITREPADGVIVPTNTELIVSGAADAVLQTIEIGLSESGTQRDIFEALFGITIASAPQRARGSIFIDEVLRNPIGRLGGAIVSVSLSSLKVQLSQSWDRVITSFVRSQSQPPDFADNLTESTVRSSLHAAFRAAADCGIRSVVTVPFGTGLNSITAENSARYMVPEIVDFLRSPNRGCLKKVTVVEECIGRFEAFAHVSKSHFGTGSYTL